MAIQAIGRAWRLGPAVGIILLTGIAFGIAAFRVTAGDPPFQFGRPFCTVVEPAGFDPWTGAGHGRLQRCALPAEAGRPQVSSEFREDPPPGLLGLSWAVPITIGAPLGCVLAGAGLELLARHDRRRRVRTVVGEVRIEATGRSRGTGR